MGYYAECKESKFTVKDEPKLLAALKDSDWEVIRDANHKIIALSFDNAYDLLRFEELFQPLIPIIDEGSFITLEGEDGTTWKFTFTKGEMKEETLKISCMFEWVESQFTFTDEAAAVKALHDEFRSDPNISEEDFVDTKTLEDVFALFDWEVERSKDRKTIELIGDWVDDATSDDFRNRYLEILAPFLQDGSYAVIDSELDMSWKITFENKKMKVQAL